MYKFAPGSNSKSVYFHLRDSTTGLAKLGLVFNSAGAYCSYTRSRATPVAITLATLAAANTAWTSGGFKEVDSTNAKGLYRLDVPDAAFAAGSAFAIVNIGFTGVIDEAVEVDIGDLEAGSGATTFTVTVNDSSTALPISGAQVWVTSDSAGANVLAGPLSTNSSGICTFYLDSGTAYVFVQAGGYSPTNPTAISVS